MAWYWAAADPRVSAIAPTIGVQSFSWALSHEAWHARAASLAPLMAAAAADLGRELDAEVSRIMPHEREPGKCNPPSGGQKQQPKTLRGGAYWLPGGARGVDQDRTPYRRWPRRFDDARNRGVARAAHLFVVRGTPRPWII